MKNEEYFIREAKETESNIVNQLLNQLIRDEKKYDDNINYNYIVKEYYQNRIDNSIIYVAIKNNNVVGYLFGYIIDLPVYIKKKAILDALYVEEKHRKSGIATSMINEFKKWVKDNKIDIIEVTVCSENKSAYNLYQKNGFEIIKYTMNKKFKN